MTYKIVEEAYFGGLLWGRVKRYERETKRQATTKKVNAEAPLIAGTSRPAIRGKWAISHVFIILHNSSQGSDILYVIYKYFLITEWDYFK